ncbi:uncharacterized protein RCO7_02688 [Rhynchosporium graminicola]|uniref:Uncharacterized protein n=1 Tax=Rhynchosporium graminicola TaxID=2792576 RepID=A0A1E1KFY0_9HELO|nr:uncharacterized protein RCO7_02688 [Rhynchosporium commune]
MDSKITGSREVGNAKHRELREQSRLLQILLGSGATPLKPLCPREDLSTINPVTTIQRLIWTSISKWHDLKRLSKHNFGLQVAFSKNNAALLCNFVIKTRYPDEAAWLELDVANPLMTEWLTLSGAQVRNFELIETGLFKEISRMLKLGSTAKLYQPALSFSEPGPVLLFGLESGIVYTDRITGSLRGALRQDVAKSCLYTLTAPWYIKPQGYGSWVLPRSNHPAITWFYDQDGGRGGAVEELEKILARAEPRERLNF